MYCKKCGAQVSVENKFCPSCGLQKPAPVYSVTSSNSTLKSVSATSKKKFPGWLIIAAIAVVVIIIIASSSSGSSGLEKDLIETLPRDLTTYVLSDDNTVHTLEVKDFKIERHSENGNYDTADCVIELEDENMQMTAYVTLQSRKYDTGWAVESWSETQEPNLVVKYEPDRQKFQAIVQERYGDYKTLTPITDEVDLDNKTYTYVCSVNDKYTYLSYTGTVTLTAAFERTGYNRSEELNEYGWGYHYPVDNIIANWDITGEWKIEEYWNELTGYWTLNIQSLDGSLVYNESEQEGIYTGYDVRSYKPWDWDTNDYANYFENEETNYNGTFKTLDLYSPKSARIIIKDSSGYGLVVYADEAIGYSNIYTWFGSGDVDPERSTEGVLSYNKY
ncbi:MAG: zinc ribbon domain-containing protein [Clostridia bacterium]|nr:zinc ribbon domain-containing protein [Clostridia bacterium]